MSAFFFTDILPYLEVARDWWLWWLQLITGWWLKDNVNWQLAFSVTAGMSIYKTIFTGGLGNAIGWMINKESLPLNKLTVGWLKAVMTEYGNLMDERYYETTELAKKQNELLERIADSLNTIRVQQKKQLEY